MRPGVFPDGSLQKPDEKTNTKMGAGCFCSSSCSHFALDYPLAYACVLGPVDVHVYRWSLVCLLVIVTLIRVLVEAASASFYDGTSA